MSDLVVDLYCGAGGASRGYVDAGFRVVGVDVNPQPNYPFRFIQDDALHFLDEHPLARSAYIFHASPPCQRWSKMTARWGRGDRYPDLIAPTRERLIGVGGVYVIENVTEAPLLDPVVLCGSMFGLKVRRHRAFESNVELITPSCDHADQGKVVGVYGHAGGSSTRDGLVFGGVQTWRTAMGINWMTGRELAEAIPPAYTEYIGRQLV